ncbi:uncharacterized protein G2W53_013589 [Senna tora]|uniref:Uncharacterized protein n=1 Tax=Senna tora TaxID=362788 RepID=A0A834U1Y2_9FABA|nr:uncharacterized protein G2W53_013589 [Senna tora]
MGGAEYEEIESVRRKMRKEKEDWCGGSVREGEVGSEMVTKNQLLLISFFALL